MKGNNRRRMLRPREWTRTPCKAARPTLECSRGRVLDAEVTDAGRTRQAALLLISAGRPSGLARRLRGEPRAGVGRSGAHATILGPVACGRIAGHTSSQRQTGRVRSANRKDEHQARSARPTCSNNDLSVHMSILLYLHQYTTQM